MTCPITHPPITTTTSSLTSTIALTLKINDEERISFTDEEMKVLINRSEYFKSSASFYKSSQPRTEETNFSHNQLTLLKDIIFQPKKVPSPLDCSTAFDLLQLDSYFMINLKEFYIEPLTEYIQTLNFSDLKENDYEIIKGLIILNLDEFKAASIINRLDTKDYLEFTDQIQILARDDDPHLTRAISRYSLKALFATHVLEIDGLTNLDWSDTPATNDQLSQITAPLTRLNLRESRVRGTAFLSQFPHLQHLDLRSTGYADLNLKDLEGLKELTHLHLRFDGRVHNLILFPLLPKLEFLELEVSGCSYGQPFEFLSQLTALKTLHLSSQGKFNGSIHSFHDEDVAYLPITIEELRIHSRHLTKNGILRIIDRLALHTLDLSYNVKNRDHADLLKALFQKPLKTLNLEKFDEDFNFKTIDLPMSTSLESLSVYSFLNAEHELKSIRLLHSKTPNLKHLKTRFYDQEYFQSLSQTFPHLEDLELFIRLGIDYSNLWSSLLTGFTSLKHLSLSLYKLPNDLRSLTHLPSNTKIQSLVLKNFSTFKSSTALFYFIGKLPSLRKLVIKPYSELEGLPNNRLEGLIDLFAMTSYLDPKNSCRYTLRELDLSNNKTITDDDLVTIVKCFPKVEHLNLSGTQITDAALKTLSQLPLISLNVERTNVTKRI